MSVNFLDPADVALARITLLVNQAFFGFASPSQAQTIAQVQYIKDYAEILSADDPDISESAQQILGINELIEQTFLNFPQVQNLSQEEIAISTWTAVFGRPPTQSELNFLVGSYPPADFGGVSGAISIMVSNIVVNYANVFADALDEIVDQIATATFEFGTPALSAVEDANFQTSGTDTIAIDENATGVVDTVVADDPTPTEAETFALVSINGAPAAGGASDAFAIDPETGVLSVNNPALLDFETTPSFSIVIEVTDATGYKSEQTLTVNLNDVDESVTTNLTTNPDVLMLGEEDDTVIGSTNINNALDTLSPGDNIDGGGGNNTLIGFLDGTGLVDGVTTTNIQEMEFTNLATGTRTVDFTLFDEALEHVTLVNNKGDFRARDVQDVGINWVIKNTEDDVQIDFAAPALAGDDDNLKVTLDGAGPAQVDAIDLFVTQDDINGPADAPDLESLSLHFVGADSFLDDISAGSVTGGGNNPAPAITTLNISGEANAYIGEASTLPNGDVQADGIAEATNGSNNELTGLQIVDASGHTGNLSIVLTDEFGILNPDFTYVGSQGDDFVYIGDTLLNENPATPQSAGTFDGGAGNNVLAIADNVSVPTTGMFAGVTNFQTVATLDDMNGGVFNTGFFPEVRNFEFRGGISDNSSIQVQQMVAGSVYTFVQSDLTPAGVGNHSATIEFDAGAVDVAIPNRMPVDVIYNQMDTDFELTVRGDELRTFTYVNDVNSTDQEVIFETDGLGQEFDFLTTLNITGSGTGEVDFRDDASAQADLLTRVDGSTVAYDIDMIDNGNFDESLDVSEDGAVILGGSGDDQLLGDSGNDEIAGNDGDDTIVGSGGDDLIFGGAGDDILFGDDATLPTLGFTSTDGSDGSDTFYSGTGADSMNGDSGADAFGVNTLGVNFSLLNDGNVEDLVDTIRDFDSGEGDGIFFEGSDTAGPGNTLELGLVSDVQEGILQAQTALLQDSLSGLDGLQYIIFDYNDPGISSFDAIIVEDRNDDGLIDHAVHIEGGAGGDTVAGDIIADPMFSVPV